MHLSPDFYAQQAPKARLCQRPKSLLKGHDPLFKRYPANDARHRILDVNTQYLIFGQSELIGRVTSGRGEIPNIGIQVQPGRVDFMNDIQRLAQVFDKRSIQVFEAQHHTGLAGPANTVAAGHR